MGFLYVASVFILIYFFLSIKKSDKKLDLILWIILSLGIMLCYNTFIVYVISIFNIKSSLICLTIINVFLSVIIYIFLVKGGEKQRYQTNKIDIVFSILIIIILGLICLFRFRNGISYDTTDSAIHYYAAKMFSQAQMQLNISNSKYLAGDFSLFQSMGYVNNGILINVLSFLPSYIAYIISESFTLIIYGLFMYVTIRKMLNNVKYTSILSFLVALMYTGGYPLNNLLIGFSYLGYGVFCANILILLFSIINDIKYNKRIIYLFIFLANFSLYFSYYLFIPIIYTSVGIYYILKLIKKEYKYKQFAKVFLFTLLLPFTIGTLHFLIIPQFFNNSVGISNAIISEGHIYRSLIANFVLLFPLIFYNIYLHIKNRKISFEIISFIICIAFTVFFLILGMNGKISSYYYYKLYYLLWLLSWIFVATIGKFDKAEKSILYFSILNILFIFFITICNIENKIDKINHYFNYDSKEIGATLLDIYQWNGAKLLTSKEVFSYKELEIINSIKAYKNDCQINGELLITGDYMKRFWFLALTTYSPVINTNNLGELYTKSFQFKEWENDNSKKCLIYFLRDYENQQIITSNTSIVFENSAGGILKKKDL